jgi:hypothetical protein
MADIVPIDIDARQRRSESRIRPIFAALVFRGNDASKRVEAPIHNQIRLLARKAVAVERILQMNSRDECQNHLLAVPAMQNDDVRVRLGMDVIRAVSADMLSPQKC